MSKDHHAEGEKDGARGKYDPPHSITPLDQTVYGKKTVEKLEKDNKEYDAGYKNARKQK
jgi:hypothetical protein